MNGETMSDRELLSDAILSQRLIGAGYNTLAGECDNPQLRSAFLNILREEQDIQADLRQELQARGENQSQPVDPQEIDRARRRYYLC